jgi:hypothetical protein
MDEKKSSSTKQAEKEEEEMDDLEKEFMEGEAEQLEILRQSYVKKAAQEQAARLSFEARLKLGFKDDEDRTLPPLTQSIETYRKLFKLSAKDIDSLKKEQWINDGPFSLLFFSSCVSSYVALLCSDHQLLHCSRSSRGLFGSLLFLLFPLLFSTDILPSFDR